MGCAFQIKDDIVDLTSDPGDTGKSTGLDIRHGIITFPVIYAIKHKTNGPSIRRLLCAEEYTPEILHRLRHLVCESGGIRFAYGEVHRFLEKARKSLEILPNGRAKEMLFDISDCLF